VIVLRRKGVIGDDVDDLNGLIHRNPGAAILMLIFLLSLAGIPPTAGFFAKLFVFWSLIQTQHYVLALLAVAYILPAVYYYFRLVAAMFVRESVDPVRPVISLGQWVALCAMVVVTLAAGILPEWFVRVATNSIFIPFSR
jgi:NADH-quinone oxidoreductase subunit N